MSGEFEKWIKQQEVAKGLVEEILKDKEKGLAAVEDTLDTLLDKVSDEEDEDKVDEAKDAVIDFIKNLIGSLLDLKGGS